MRKSLLKLSLFITGLFLAFSFSVAYYGESVAYADSPDASQIRQELERLTRKIELIRAILERHGFDIGAPLTRDCAQIKISWEPVSRATGYKLYRGEKLVYEGSAREYIDTGLTPSQEYEYTVYGLYRDQKGESLNFEIKAPPVCPPRSLSLRADSQPCGGQITLNWHGLAVDTYELYRGNRKIYSGSALRYTDSGLNPNQRYEYRLRAGNRGGWSDFEVKEFTSSGVCAPSDSGWSYVIPEIDPDPEPEDPYGEEGELFIISSRFSYSSVILDPPSKNRNITSFNLRPEGSDVSIHRVNLHFDTALWRYLDKISLYHGSKMVGSINIDRDNVRNVGDGNYRVRVPVTDMKLRKNSVSTLYVRVDARDDRRVGEPLNVSIFLENRAIRATDQAGLSIFIPRDEGGKKGNFSGSFQIR